MEGLMVGWGSIEGAWWLGGRRAVCFLSIAKCVKRVSIININSICQKLLYLFNFSLRNSFDGFKIKTSICRRQTVSLASCQMTTGDFWHPNKFLREKCLT